jgi:transcription antitermination factor NusG
MILKKPDYKWYAVYTKINSEKKILEELQEQEIESYLPLKKTLRQWSDRKKWIEEPLFRSYVFVKVSHIEFFDVLAVPGVVCYVSFGGRAQAIPEYQIENVKAFVQQEKNEIILTKELIEKGAKVEVLYGPLKGVKGEIIKIFGQYRILIRVDAMGCSLHTNISKEEIKFLNTKDLRVNKKVSQTS